METPGDLTAIGQFTNLEDTEFKLHPQSSPSGGIITSDKDGIIASAVKEVAGKIAQKALKG